MTAATQQIAQRATQIVAKMGLVDPQVIKTVNDTVVMTVGSTAVQAQHAVRDTYGVRARRHMIAGEKVAAFTLPNGGNVLVRTDSANAKGARRPTIVFTQKDLAELLPN